MSRHAYSLQGRLGCGCILEQTCSLVGSERFEEGLQH